MSNKKLSLIAPCYNEEGNIEGFHKLIKETFQNSKFDYEIIFINDGSKDNTYSKLKEIYENDKNNVVVINFIHNFGKEAAILAGLKKTSGNYVCVIDSDMQQHPKYAIEMAEILENNETVDMVAAKPSNQKDSALLSFFKNNFYKTINFLSDVKFYRNVSDFRVFRKQIADIISNMPEHDRFSKGIFSFVCPDIECIEYEVQARQSGTTKWSFLKLFKYAFDGICSFSNVPLVMPMGFSVLSFLASLIIMGFIIAHYICGFGNISILWILFAVSLSCCIQSFNSGMIAKYIAKINKETTNRPIYIIKNILEKEV